MITEKVTHWKNKLCNLKIDNSTKCYVLCSLDGFFIGLGDRFIIKKIDDSFIGIAATVLQELIAAGIIVLSSITGYCLEKGFSQQ